MKMIITSVYDKVEGSFGRPFFVPNEQVSIRMIRELLKEENKVSRHPSDHVLYKLGDFDTVTGFIHPESIILSPVDLLIQPVTMDEVKKP